MKYGEHLLHHRCVWSIGEISRTELFAVLDLARELKRATQEGRPRSPLRGRHIAIVSAEMPADRPDAPDSLRRAANELGARVTQLQPTGSSGDLRLLGRLYDAIDCVGLSAAMVERIEHDAGVPVFNGLATPEHPARAIGELMEMQERANKPLRGLRVALAGDAHTPRGEALQQLAQTGGLALSAAGTATQPGDADFFIDASDPAHWRCASAGNWIGEGDSADDHRYVLEALLVMTLA